MANREGLEGIAVADSAITRIDGLRGEIDLHGYPLPELARASRFEEVAYLLWNGELPQPAALAELEANLSSEREFAAPAIQIMRAIPPDAHPLEALRAAVS